MSRWNLAWLVGVPAFVVFGLTVVFAAPHPSRPKDQDYELIQTFVEVLSEVDKHYVRELSPEQKRKLVADMINGGLARLDPYSIYYDVDEYAQFERQTAGNFGGVGIYVSTDRQTGLPRVTSPMFGTPAYEAGILAGDLILKVNGKSTEEILPGALVKTMQGPPGSEVTLTILHEGADKPVDITIKRAKIESPSIMADQHMPDNPGKWDYFVDKDSRIAYIRLVAFNEHAETDLQKAVEEIQAQGARGLILDLRDNPGGLLTQAVEICDLFMDAGTIVSTRDRNGKGRTYSAKAEGTLLEPAATHPMAVLVNRDSASASEIVAAALQDSKRAVIVGERSYGKGSVQNVIELGDHEPKVALKLTTASYWRPSGANINRNPDSKETDDWGVKPNPGYEIKLDLNERLAYARWRRQRDTIQGKPGLAPVKKVEKAEKPEAPFTDKYLDKALDYIRSELKKP